ncbi:MAG: pyruvate dehydrogenase (acetyl-transferring) E1 component subunit alpha [SAR202 cluster bacterium Io17-Chloro-G2]|nr:MAG: pyruvate dehydrogenase (acetyl-transferring) E1 component subunit alpha [SAR202 cluster bacterium Io17-Chloro-G2]
MSKVQLLEFYRLMLLIREFERECERQYTRGNIKGFLHVYTGEEAIAVGAISTLSDQDYVVTHYRDHGHALARGLDSNGVMAELFGKATGVSRGKGGSMHLFDASKNFMGGYAIVGGQLPIAAGLALASQYNDENRVALCFMGDGALNEGEFHETMNLAAVWKLPVIFFCENNLYGMGAPSADTLAVHKQMYKLAEAYGMDDYRVDGNDVVAVHELMLDVVENVRSGKGPAFIEAKTYRMQGHSIADPANYRPDEEVEYWRSQDPIPRYKEWLSSQGLASEEEFDQIDAGVDQQVVAAAEFAEASPFPEPEALYQGVYGDVQEG